jgi:predicted methyltransferase
MSRLFTLILLAITLTLPAQAQPSSEIISAVNTNPLRSAEEIARDPHRHPDEILAFWGIQPQAKVVDLGAGGGYYTKILAAYLKTGHVTAINADFFAKNPRFANTLKAMETFAQQQKNVSHQLNAFDQLALPAQLDGALFVNFYHDTTWLGYDRQRMNQAIFKALKPGGKLLVIDHEAPLGSGFEVGQSLHRVEGQALLQEVLDAGFHLIKTSNILQRKDDVLNASAVDVEARRGQTSRFVYLFEKPLH